MSDDISKIKVFASDDNLKSLGELLSNDTSRNIIYNLMTNEMYTNEIATKLDMRVSLVIHHLKKLEVLGMLEISEKKLKRKGQKHRFFKINFDIFITIDKTKENIKERGFLSKIFRDGVKLSTLVITSTLTWLFTLKENQISKSDITLDRSVYTPDETVIDIPLISSLNSDWFVIPVVITLGVFLIWFSRKYK